MTRCSDHSSALYPAIPHFQSFSLFHFSYIPAFRKTNIQNVSNDSYDYERAGKPFIYFIIYGNIATNLIQNVAIRHSYRSRNIRRRPCRSIYPSYTPSLPYPLRHSPRGESVYPWTIHPSTQVGISPFLHFDGPFPPRHHPHHYLSCRPPSPILILLPLPKMAASFQHQGCSLHSPYPRLT